MTPELPKKPEYQVGVLSDTHGHIPQTAITRLNGTDLIIHAGDIDTPEILTVLKRIAPLVVVRGNMDGGPWALHLPATEAIEVGRVWIYVLHDLGRLDLTPKAAGFRVIVSGHTHRAQLLEKEGTLYLNPGSVSHPRHPSPASMAILNIRDGNAFARFIDLDRDRSLNEPF
jgi:putative phosphoesterase